MKFIIITIEFPIGDTNRQIDGASCNLCRVQLGDHTGKGFK